MYPQISRAALRRVVAVINGKGGVGKTMLVTHIAAILAALGYRVLVVDLDPQNDTGKDLGTRNRAAMLAKQAEDAADPEERAQLAAMAAALGHGDMGLSLSIALQTDRDPVLILKDVRPRLDVIPGGPAMADIVGVITSRSRPGSAQSIAGMLPGHAMLASVLSRIAPGYDLVLLDCPPGERSLQEAAVGAAEWLFMPVHSDEGSLEAVEAVAQRMAAVADVNPDAKPLGMVLYGTGARATAIHKKVRKWHTDHLAGEVPMFQQIVRHAEGPADAVREVGLLVFEQEAKVAGITTAVANAARPLATDLEGVATEFVMRLLAGEAGKEADEEAIAVALAEIVQRAADEEANRKAKRAVRA